MEEIKIGSDVLVRGKVEEIRETAKGKVFKITIKNKVTYNQDFTIDEVNAIHVNKG